MPKAVWASMSSGGQGDGGSDALSVVSLEFAGGRMAQLIQNRLCKGETHYFEVRADTTEASYRASFGGRARVTTGLYRSTRPHVRVDYGVSGLAWIEQGNKRKLLARNPANPRVVSTRLFSSVRSRHSRMEHVRRRQPRTVSTHCESSTRATRQPRQACERRWATELTRIPNLRIAIVGAGLMGRAHAHASTRAGAKVVAVADTDPLAARTLASSLGRNVLAGSADELIRPERLDAIHVCTPPGHHIEACNIAIERGIHVLCEKPLADSAQETQSLFDFAGERGVIMCPVHQFPFQQGAAVAAASLTSIGKIRWITAEMCTAGATTVVDSRHNEILLNIVPHPLSLIYAFLGGGLADGTWATTHASTGAKCS